ncbi:hypothetical protein FF1_035345 [Malus domestica]
MRADEADEGLTEILTDEVTEEVDECFERRSKLCSILKSSDNAMVSNNALLAPAIEKSGMTAGMIKSLLCKSHAVFFEEFDVRLVDKRCAIVVFWRCGLSETFLDAFSSEDICDSLMEIALEGIRASSYKTYKRVCRLGLWEADLVESLDKALEDSDCLTEVNSATNSKEIYWSSNWAINFDDL